LADKDFAKELPRRIVIVGDGVEAWLSAVILQHRLAASGILITVLTEESSEPGCPVVSAGPGFAKLFTQLGIDEFGAMRQCEGTYRLGTQYRDWNQHKRDYWHPYGICGAVVDGCDIFLIWHSERAHGRVLRPYQSYSLNWSACVAGNSPRSTDTITPIQTASAYGFHFERQSFVQLLKQHAADHGVEIVEDTLAGVSPNGRGGIAQVKTLSSGNLPAEFYIDCTGYRSALLGREMDDPFIEWNSHLLCDSVVSGSSAGEGRLPPHSCSLGTSGGSCTTVRLTDQTYHSFNYSSHHCNEEDTEAVMVASAGKHAVNNLSTKRYSVGRQTSFWKGNVLGAGTAACNVSPNDCSALSLTQHGIEMFLRFMPDRNRDQLVREQYNLRMTQVAESLRDFEQLRYHLSSREDSEFWMEGRSLPLSDKLVQTLALYFECGFIDDIALPHVTASDYYYILTGNGRLPRRPSGTALGYSSDDANEVLRVIQKQNDATMVNLPLHEDFLREVGVLAKIRPLSVTLE
jgi:tryptophan halogenase